MSESNEEWINNLKVGDKVIMDQSQYGETNMSLSTVSRITPTLIIISNSNNYEFKYRKTDGRLVGKDMWSRNSIIEATDERINTIKEDWLRFKAKKAMRDYDVNSLSIENVKKILDILR